MNDRGGWAALCWCALTVAAGCDAIGAGLVDEYDNTRPLNPEVFCATPPICFEQLPPVLDVQPVALAPVDMARCERNRDARCRFVTGIEDAPVVPETELGWLDGCSPEPPPRVVYDEGNVCAPLATLQCSDLLIEGDALLDDATTQRIDDAVWSGVEVVIRSTQPLLVEIADAWLFDVSFTLQGPVTLRIVDSRFAWNLRVRSDSATLQQARVELVRVRGKHVVLGDVAPANGDAHASRGIDISLDHVELNHVQLVADRLSLESVNLKNGLVEARDVSAVDTHVIDSELGADHSVFTAFSWLRVQQTRCATLSLIDGRAMHSQVAPCLDRSARIYSVTLLHCAIDGDVESDDSVFSLVRIGARSATSITAWRTRFSSVALCGELRELRLVDSAEVECSSCPDGMRDATAIDASASQDEPDASALDAWHCDKFADLSGAEVPVCVVSVDSSSDDEPTELPGNYCEALHAVPACDSPYPISRRPPPPPDG